MFTTKVGKLLILKDRKRKYWGAWFQPPVWDKDHPELRALWWVTASAEALAGSVRDYQESLEGESEQERLRARAVVAADRALFVFWASRYRRQATFRGITPDAVREQLGQALGLLDDAGEAIGGSVAPVYLPHAVRAYTRRTGGSEQIRVRDTYESASLSVGLSASEHNETVEAEGGSVE